MANLSPAHREMLITTFSQWLRDKVGDPSNDVEFEIHNGTAVTYGDDLTQPALDQNGSATLTIRINGGAHHTQHLSD